ncbi:MAG TPA: 23S rRNA pseudouridine(1911/1915/1917) synthase RluD [Azospira sp.]|nr:23S rRNA pseudouridine(1911/1915/1917) synthase RluD [Azospira sp.]
MNAGDYSAKPLSSSPSSPAASAPEPIFVPLDAGGRRLDQALAQLLPQYSRNRLQTWIREGRVLLGGTPVLEPKHKLLGGESLTVLEVQDEKLAAETPEDIPFPVVYEDEAILVINKPAGLVVHPGSGNWSGTLLNALLHHAPQLAQVPRAGIVHRLDKDTSGLMVVAKTLEAQTDLVRQLQARTVKREYRALLVGYLNRNGTVDAPIGRHPTQRTKMAVLQHNGRDARTHYTVLEHFERCTLVQCRLETGRTHQIRVHMAALGFPLVGDGVYNKGKTAGVKFHRQALHAYRLGLIHPLTREAMQWDAPVPEDMAALLKGLRNEWEEQKAIRRQRQAEAWAEEWGDDDWEEEEGDAEMEADFENDEDGEDGDFDDEADE